jgi:hypothetical protein
MKSGGEVGGAAKKFWVSLPKQTREKNLIWGTITASGTKNTKQAQNPEINKCTVIRN